MSRAEEQKCRRPLGFALGYEDLAALTPSLTGKGFSPHSPFKSYVRRMRPVRLETQSRVLLPPVWLPPIFGPH